MWEYLESLYTQFSGRDRKSNISKLNSYKILQYVCNIIFLYFDLPVSQAVRTKTYNIHHGNGTEIKIGLKRESAKREDYLNTEDNISEAA
mgnify:FL=1